MNYLCVHNSNQKDSTIKINEESMSVQDYKRLHGSDARISKEQVSTEQDLPSGAVLNSKVMDFLRFNKVSKI